MLLDRKHKPWLIWTTAVAAVAVVAYASLWVALPGQRTAGSTTGLWYGIAGAGLMVGAALLSVVKRLPIWWRVGPRSGWLRAHLWLGSLAAIFIICHSGFHAGSPLECLLWLAAIGVFVTGIAGVLFQQMLPRFLAARVPCEAPPGQLSHTCRVLRRRGDGLVDQVCGPHDPRGFAGPAGRSPIDARRHLRAFYETEVRPFLGREQPRRMTLADPLRAASLFGRLQGMSALDTLRPYLEQLAALCQERRLLAEQERLHFWLHSWLFLHVPLSAVLLILTAAHVAVALYF